MSSRSVHQQASDDALLLKDLSKHVASLTKELANLRAQNKSKDEELKTKPGQIKALLSKIQYFQSRPDDEMSRGSGGRRSHKPNDAYCRETMVQVRRFLNEKFNRRIKLVPRGWKMYAPDNPRSFFSLVLPHLVLPPNVDLRYYWHRVLVDLINKLMITSRSNTTTAIRNQYMRKTCLSVLVCVCLWCYNSYISHHPCNLLHPTLSVTMLCTGVNLSENDALGMKYIMNLLVLNKLPPAENWTHPDFNALCLFVMYYVVKIYGVTKVAAIMKKNPGLTVIEWLTASDYGYAVFIIMNGYIRWNQQVVLGRMTPSEKDESGSTNKASTEFTGNGSSLHNHAVTDEGQAFLAGKTGEFQALFKNKDWSDKLADCWLELEGKPFKECYEVDDDINDSASGLDVGEDCPEFDLPDDDDEFGVQQDYSDDDVAVDDDEDGYTLEDVNRMASRSRKSSSNAARVSTSSSKSRSAKKNGKMSKRDKFDCDTSELDNSSDEDISLPARKKPRKMWNYSSSGLENSESEDEYQDQESSDEEIPPSNKSAKANRKKKNLSSRF